MPISSVLGSSALLPAGVGMRNKIINGDMRINQRSSGVITGAGSRQFPVDQWAVWNGTGTVTFQQSTVTPPGFAYSLLATVTGTGSYGTNGYTQMQIKVEGSNCTDLSWGTSSAKQVIISFWCQSSVVGTYTVSIGNSDRSRVYVAPFTVNSANTWEYKVLVIPGDTSGTWLKTTGIGFDICVNLGFGTGDETTPNVWSGLNKLSVSSSVDFAANLNATFYITGFQVEQNTQPTPFESRPIGVELALCQRYYYRYSNPTLNGGGLGYLAGFSSTRSFGTINIPVEMRGTITITPTSCTVDSLSLSNVGSVTAIAAYATTGNAPYTTTLFVDCTTSNTVAGTLYLLRVSSGGQVQFSAEL